MLLPAAPQDWLPAGHLAHFINDTVDALHLKAFYARYEGGGSRNQPFHPAMMVKVLGCACTTGVFSSRKIERRLHEDLAFRMLAAGNFSRHRTLCDFRAFHLKELSELFVQVVRLAREMGLVKLGTVAIDGNKVKANASRHKAMSYERMQQAEIELKAQIDALLARAKAIDETEANEPELDLPAEIERRETRLAAIGEARERLEQRQREADLQGGLPQAQVDRRAAQRLDPERAGVPAVQHAGPASGAGRVEARVHGAEPAAHGGAERPLRGAEQLVKLTGASLAEGGWRVRSNMLELPLGGGSGEPCVQPQARRLRGFCRADS